MKFVILIYSICFCSTFLMSQDQKTCASEEAKQFDFWVGKWEATWEGGKGVNNISKILDGCVIFEEFDATPSSPMIGKSVSVYSKRTGKWHQTWVDNSGGYLDFVGQWQNDRMILSRSFELKDHNIMQRMVWYNITSDQFDWNWEKSVDGGKTWTVSWQIHYSRMKS